MSIPPPYMIASRAEVTEALKTALRDHSYGLSREVGCFLAGVAAEHLANCLAASGFVVMRPDTQPQLEL